MSARYDCTDAAQRVTGLAEAAASLRKGDLAVIPTDTVYGLAADAFSPPAVTGLLTAKGRDRQMPPPVLVGTVRAATALVEDLSASGKDLIDEFWPGGLTLVLRANRNLIWDLGDTKGTVAVRMPLHEITLELLKETGPLAVSSANRSGAPPATTAADAEAQLGEAVAVYLDGGPCSRDVPSTIVDLTGAIPKLRTARWRTARRRTARRRTARWRTARWRTAWRRTALRPTVQRPSRGPGPRAGTAPADGMLTAERRPVITSGVPTCGRPRPGCPKVDLDARRPSLAVVRRCVNTF